MSGRITLSLISHTNVGKTTLARTLLRRDVGEVRDQAHVTDENAEYELLSTGSATLVLWDTPGFGDTARLMRRLRHERDPLGWFLHQVWDRFLDRPLWCGQQAVENVRDQADVVLYLVNASESPEEAGYPRLELELLTWIGRPVLILLNQVGDAADARTAWEEFAADVPIVGGVLSLDAFTRCWVQESILLRRVVGLLPDEVRRRTMSGLADAWDARNDEVFRRSCERLGAYLARAAADREPLAGDDESSRGPLERLSGALHVPRAGRRRAMRRLAERLDDATARWMSELIGDHGLVGDSAERIEKRLQDYRLHGAHLPLDERSGALAGAVVSGALGGLVADLLSGGLTLGGGVIAGTILGALGGSALAKGYRLIGGNEQPGVGWAPEFLDELFRLSVLRYLAVAHFGRGRGRFRDLERPAGWTREVEAATRETAAALHRLWRDAESGRVDAGGLERPIADAARSTIARVLAAAYPEAQGSGPASPWRAAGPRAE